MVKKCLIHYCITESALNSSPETIADLSSLTRIQVETLKTHLAVNNNEINMKDALKSRKTSGISRGTHYRILAQAKKNVKRSLFTVATASQLGLLKPEDVQKLISTVTMIPGGVDPDKLPEILALVNAVADRIVML
jgi:Glu-tRNA(Gln) amidotransferase subunit E-like FAD-binding protein